jgi:hypothetical protein
MCQQQVKNLGPQTLNGLHLLAKSWDEPAS